MPVVWSSAQGVAVCDDSTGGFVLPGDLIGGAVLLVVVAALVIALLLARVRRRRPPWER